MFERFNRYGKLQLGLALSGLLAQVLYLTATSFYLLHIMSWEYSIVIGTIGLNYAIFTTPFLIHTLSAYFHTDRSSNGRFFGIIGAIIVTFLLVGHIFIDRFIFQDTLTGYIIIGLNVNYILATLIFTALNQIRIRQEYFR